MKEENNVSDEQNQKLYDMLTDLDFREYLRLTFMIAQAEKLEFSKILLEDLGKNKITTDYVDILFAVGSKEFELEDYKQRLLNLEVAKKKFLADVQKQRELMAKEKTDNEKE